MSGSILYMPLPSPDMLIDHLKSTHAARTRSVRALRDAQVEYLAANQARKRAAWTVLDMSPNRRWSDTGTFPTNEQLVKALGLRTRGHLYQLAELANGRYEFGGDDVLAELREITERYHTARRRRRELVRELRHADKDERLTFEEMGAAMGLTGEGVRYLTRGSKG